MFVNPRTIYSEVILKTSTPYKNTRTLTYGDRSHPNQICPTSLLELKILLLVKRNACVVPTFIRNVIVQRSREVRDVSQIAQKLDIAFAFTSCDSRDSLRNELLTQPNTLKWDAKIQSNPAAQGNYQFPTRLPLNNYTPSNARM